MLAFDIIVVWHNHYHQLIHCNLLHIHDSHHHCAVQYLPELKAFFNSKHCISSPKTIVWSRFGKPNHCFWRGKAMPWIKKCLQFWDGLVIIVRYSAYQRQCEQRYHQHNLRRLSDIAILEDANCCERWGSIPSNARKRWILSWNGISYGQQSFHIWGPQWWLRMLADKRRILPQEQ